MESIKNEVTEAQEQVVERAVYQKPVVVSFDADSTGKISNSSEGAGDGHGSAGPS